MPRDGGFSSGPGIGARIARMSGLRDGWFIANAAGDAVGPLSRHELVARYQRGDDGPDALAWHVEEPDWRPLARIAAQTAPEAPTETRAESRARVHATQVAAARAVGARTESIRSASTTAAGADRPSKAERKRLREQASAKAARAHASSAKAMHAADDQRLLRGDPRALEQLAKLPPKERAAAIKAQVSPEAAKSGERAGVAMRRFLARLIDTLTLGVAAATVAWAWWLGELAASFGFTLAAEPIVLLVIAVLALVPVEALALSFAGTTPGKALMGLDVVDPDGTRPGLPRALGRAARVALRGMALGIPFFAVIAMIVGLAKFTSQGRSTWDREVGTEVRARAIEAWRWQAALFALFVAFLVLSSGWWGELAGTLAR